MIEKGNFWEEVWKLFLVALLAFFAYSRPQCKPYTDEFFYGEKHKIQIERRDNE